MDLVIQNKYVIADGSAENVDSLMECTDKQRLSLDEVSFGEFDTSNIPTMLKGSLATVNGALCGPATADGAPLYIGNDSGSTFKDASEAPIGYNLFLCLIPSAPQTVTYALKACAGVAYDVERCGFYETGTQNRVFGMCVKTAPGVFPKEKKRLYSRPAVIESLLKTYGDGIDINIRKMDTVNTLGRVVSNVYTSSPNADYQAAVTNLFKIRVDYPLTLEVAENVKTWCDYYPLGTKISGCEVLATLLGTDNSTEIGVQTRSLIEGVPDSLLATSAAGVTNLLYLPVGSYQIKLKTVVQSNGTYLTGLHVNTIAAHIRNIFGNRVGAWGAII